MNWDFLKLNRDGRNVGEEGSSVASKDSTNSKDNAAQNQADLHLIKPFDARALGSARETVRDKLDDFESVLQTVSRLPDQFRLVMSPIENAVNAMALMRNKLEIAEDNFATEHRKTSNLITEVSRLQTEMDRTSYALKSEEAACSALREQNSNLDASVTTLKQDNAELHARVARIEPQLRDVLALKDSFEGELLDLRRNKINLEDVIVGLKTEISELRDEIASRDNLHTTLQTAHSRMGERLDESMRSIAELEAALKSTTDKFAFANAALVRERNAARAARTENEQLYKEREEAKVQYESQIEAAKARYEFVEKMLQEARARFQEETKHLSVSRRERVERDREIGRITLALEAVQRESNELRAQISSSSETVSATSALLAQEIEHRRRLELDIDLLRSENSALLLKQKSLTDSARTIESTIGEATTRFQSRVSYLSAENERLRSELNSFRNLGEKTYDKEFAALFSDLAETKGAPKEENKRDDENIHPIR